MSFSIPASSFLAAQSIAPFLHRRAPLVGVLTTMFLVTALAWGSDPAPGENRIANGTFQEGLSRWNTFWARDAEGGQVILDERRARTGRQSVRIEHAGARDWNLDLAERLPVEAGEVYELSAWVQVEGEHHAGISVVLRDAAGEVLDWSFASQSNRRSDDWRHLVTRFAIPRGTATIHPRLLGHGPATVWLDDVRLARTGSLGGLEGELPAELTVANEWLSVALDTAEAALSVTDRRNGATYRQLPAGGLMLVEAAAEDRQLTMRLVQHEGVAYFAATVTLDAAEPEFIVELTGEGELTAPLRFPPPFASQAGESLIMPVNQGISYPVDDATLQPMDYYLYGGHGLCMAWYGATAGEAGWMAIVETPNDAVVGVPRLAGRLALAPAWVGEKGRFGYPRQMRYVFLDQGGYVAMAHRYRRHAEQQGLVKTLTEKREENADVDLLVGAVNVWCWSPRAVEIVARLQAAGMDRILWSARAEPEQLERLNAMGVLTSRYDIYQDVMNPAHFPHLRGVHPDWTTAAWPDDLILDADGTPIDGWGVQGRDGTWYHCNVLCDRRALDYARERIPAELATHPYRGRFIDTTTASPWRECYHDDHPMTRSESRHWKMELLRYVSEECCLVTGCETGHEASVPFLHFFEGMMSLGPYRVPDAGRRIQDIVDDVPDLVARFQTGHGYRLPLWELVYSDCVVSHWYWGDYNNKLPALWDRRDSGTPSTALRRCSCSTRRCSRRTSTASWPATRPPPPWPAPPATPA
jgi:hypothetical protein